MRKTALILGVALLAAYALGGEAITFTASTGTNTTVTAYATPFTGEIDEIAVYSTVSTGDVSIAALDPYSGSALVLGTNSGRFTALVFTPRVAAASATGSVARTVGQTLSNDRLNMQGERLRAVITNSRTGVTYRVVVKTK